MLLRNGERHVDPGGDEAFIVDVVECAAEPPCARLYACQAERAEALGLADRRRGLLAGLSGRVLEIGAGTGTNLRHYPAAVTRSSPSSRSRTFGRACRTRRSWPPFPSP